MNTNNGWLDIASAPKDSFIFDGLHHYGAKIIVFDGSINTARWWRTEGGSASNFIDEGGRAIYPTHWMPLPAAPGSPASTVADEGEKDERRTFEAWAGNKGWPLSPYQNNCGIVVAERYGHRTVQKAWEAWQERASTGAPAAGDARAWQRLTDAERDGYVGELVDYGTDFVAPLYSVVESIEKRLREKNTASQQGGE